MQAVVWPVDPAAMAGPMAPIGRPIHNVEAHLLGPSLERVPVGVPGELFLGGACGRARVLGAGRPHGRALRPRSHAGRAAGRAAGHAPAEALPDGRSLPAPGGRPARVPRPRRPAGEGARAADRARGDRGIAPRSPRGAGGRRRRARGRGRARRRAPRRLRLPRRRRDRDGRRSAGLAEGAPPRADGALGGRDARRAPAHPGERQDRPPRAPRSGRGLPRPARSIAIGWRRAGRSSRPSRGSSRRCSSSPPTPSAPATASSTWAGTPSWRPWR